MKIFDGDTSIDTRTLPDKGLAFQVRFDDNQKQKLAQRFDLSSIPDFKGEASLRFKGDILLFEGSFEAEVIQKCVISLKPVSAKLSEKIILELVSPEEATRRDAAELFLDPDEPDYDSFDGYHIMPGEILAQTLSMALDPYPRHPDADLEKISSYGVEINGDTLKSQNPFAVLKDITKKT